MRKKLLTTFFLIVIVHHQLQAQVTEIVTIIKAAVTKVIKAIDLEVQRMQTETIWLQNAQKELENTMSALKLDEITGWVQHQKDLFEGYYQELQRVKSVIADYEKVKQIIVLQGKIVSEFQTYYGKFRQDRNFSPQELEYMYQIFSAMVSESLKNLQNLTMVVTDFLTQMSDGARLTLINETDRSMNGIYDRLRKFSDQQVQLSLERAKASGDIETIRQLYGIH